MSQGNAFPIVFHHHPWSRAAGTRWLLEELELDYETAYVDFHAAGGVPEPYRRIQPHKKVPAVQVGDLTITERAAITIYLADRFSLGQLAPALDDPRRARYLTALVYNDAVLDPCITAHVRGLGQAPADYSFGAFDDLVTNLERHFEHNAYAVGDSFTAADTQLASSIGFTMRALGALPRKPAFEAYLERATDRPAHARAAALDQAWLDANPEVVQRALVAQQAAS